MRAPAFIAAVLAVLAPQGLTATGAPQTAGVAAGAEAGAAASGGATDGGAQGGGAAGAAASVTGPDAPSPALARLLRDADRWLLTGAEVPPELPRLLDPLAPADRVTAVAYLRRVGLLAGPALDIAHLLDAPEAAAR